MIDEIFDRAYRESRAELNAGLASAFASAARTIGDSFRVLHRIEWSAPWHAKDKRSQYN